MKEMNCMLCKYHSFCEEHNYIIDVTTSEDFGWHYYVFNLGVEPPIYCPYRMKEVKE